MSESDAMLAVLGINQVLDITFPPRKKKRMWSKKLLLKRDTISHTAVILPELDADEFRNYLRMDETVYECLLSLVSERLSKNSTVMRTAITPHDKLTATLRFLATGRNYTDLKYSTALSQPSLSNIIPETCQVLYDVLKNDYLKFPKSENDWLEIAQLYENLWDFPNCVGAMDGKHVRIEPPPESGAYYRNYKGYDSMVLLGIVDANYKFILVDFGTNGRVSDGGVLEKTKFHDKLKSNDLKLPKSRLVGDRVLRYVFIGDEAFALRTDFLKPFNFKGLSPEQRIYNYRLSWSRRVVENVFGILASRFQIFHTSIKLKIENIQKVVMACCALHNFLRTMCASQYSPKECFYSEDISEGSSRPGLINDNDLMSLQIGQNRNASEEAKAAREEFVKYFNNEGAVPWQSMYI